MRKSAGTPVLLSLFLLMQPASAKDKICDARTKKGVVCLCEISDLHPTQASVGMEEVRSREETLKAEFARRSASDFRAYLKEHEKAEPVVIGPGGVFYITDGHHLARALYEAGAPETYCKIDANLRDARPKAFWKKLERNNEVYLKDANGDPITPAELPASVKDLANNPFRSLAGAVRESCGFKKGDPKSRAANFLEFKWADYFRAHWAQTGIPAGDIDADFSDATLAALRLAAAKDAAGLPGFTGKTACD